jgi:multiple sugar transport system substrate-binding protein
MDHPNSIICVSKRIFLIVFFGFLFGCSQQRADQVTLKVAINAGPEGNAIKSLVAEGYPKAKIEIVELPYQSLREQLITVLGESRPGFDVVMVDDPWFPQLASNLKELTSIPQSLVADIVPSSLRLCRDPYPGGKLRALPFVGNTQVLFYRKDILERLGVTIPPNSWEKVANLASSIVETSEQKLGKKVYGYAIRGKSGAPIVTDFLPVYWSMGGKILDDPGVPHGQGIDKGKFIQALRIYKKLMQASPPGSLNFDWSEMTADFTNGRVAIELNWPAAIPTIDEGIRKGTGKTGWAIALPPGEKAEGTSMIGNWLLAVPARSVRPKEAEDFIVWLMEQQGRVASSGNPPTRISVFTELAKSPGKEYFGVILHALERSTPRDRTPQWAQIEDAVSRAVSGYLSGKLNEEAAANQFVKDIESLFPRR